MCRVWRQEAARKMHDSRAGGRGWCPFVIPSFLNSNTSSVVRYAFNLITNFQGVKKHCVKFAYLSYASTFPKCRNNTSRKAEELCPYVSII